MNQSPSADFSWFPIEPAGIGNVGIGGRVFLIGFDGTIWDSFRIDMITLELQYQQTDGNTSAEVCISPDAGTTLVPMLAVATHANESLSVLGYDNKVFASLQGPFFMWPEYSLWLRSESQVTSDSTCSSMVFSSAARMPGS